MMETRREYQPTVGMEIHVELKTKTKMFCGCKNDPFHSEPNSNVCPICFGLPGTLPLLNKQAVKMVVSLGQALKGKVAEESFWARKNYFYPDLPKGYQISQSTAPLMTDGQLTIDGQAHRIARVHLEEDAAKLFHLTDGSSGVDYNRAGVPLIEIITEPDFHSSASTKRFCQELQAVLRHLELSDADMEKGQMRCEVNISVAREGEPLGQKVEVKNINSFRAVERTIEFEYKRQVEALEAGDTIVQETRTWDEKTQGTKTMRVKETSADYRYFPEPDIPTVKIQIPNPKSQNDLPEEQRKKLIAYNLPEDLAETVVKKSRYQKTMELLNYLNDPAGMITKFDSSDMIAGVKLGLQIPRFNDLRPIDRSSVVWMMKEHGWTKQIVGELIQEVLEKNVSPASLEGKFTLDGDNDLSSFAKDVVVENQQAVEEYRAGKEQALNFLVGRLMAKTQGRANIHQARETLLKELTGK